ncbi:MAG: 16S rRNA (guanine(527)-N(7))-methyltransferase RsmG, partial [Alphaproteobacteria bacterium]
AGFPGLVLAIAAGIPMTLVEADRRKAAFLATVIAETGTPATVLNRRIEALAAGDLPPPAIITARALKPLPQLLALAARWLEDGQAVLWAWKGARWEEELTAARKDWIFTVESHPSRTQPAARLLRIANLGRRKGNGRGK